MLNIIATNQLSGIDDTSDGVTVIHPPVYVLVCKDNADNKFEIETNRETYTQVSNFLDKLRSV